MKIKLFLNPGTLIISLLLLSACFQVKPILLKGIDGVKIEKIEEGKAYLNLAFRIENQNKTNVRVKRIDIDVLYNNISLGKLVDEKGFLLKKESIDVYNIPVQIDLNVIKKNTKSILKSFFKKGITVNIKGSLKAGSALITKKIEINEETQIDLVSSLFD